MDVVAMYDYYFHDAPYRTFDHQCEFVICDASIVYKRLEAAVAEERPRDTDGTEPNRLSADVLEYMLYNVSGDTGLPAHYSCCMQLNGTAENSDQRHVCNVIPIMIGSRLERKVLARLADMLRVPCSDLYDTDYLHRVYAGSFLVNGTFYYSVFRESNNNKICHNTKSKYRGEETVAYFYDTACNRGVKLFTDSSGQLRVNDRDGNEVREVTAEVMLQLYKECVYNWHHYTLDMSLVEGFFSSVKRQGLTGIDDFKNKIYTNYSVGLNTFLNKLPSAAMSKPAWNASLMVGKVNMGISQRLAYPKSKSETKKQNEQKLKMCSGGMSTDYLVETQRRRNVRKNDRNGRGTYEKKNGSQRLGHVFKRGRDPPKSQSSSRCDGTRSAEEPGARTQTENRDGSVSKSSGVKRKRIVVSAECNGCDRSSNKKKKTKTRENETTVGAVRRSTTFENDESASHTILGSKDVKTGGLMEKLELGERNGPSTFNQVSVSYLPLIRVLSNTVQKLQVEHVHAESSKTVPRDAYGFICMKYMGNISTAGKNMLFTDRVEVSYGHVHRTVEAVEAGIDSLCGERSERRYGGVLLQRLVERHGTSTDPYGGCESKRPVVKVANGERLHVVINNAVTVWSVARSRLLEFVVLVKSECHPFVWTKIVGDYLCIYYYEGVPLMCYKRKDEMFRRLSAALGPRFSRQVDSLYFSRDELEMLASTDMLANTHVTHSAPRPDVVDRTNALIDEWCATLSDGGPLEPSSLLARHLDQYTDQTAPAKRSVSVNARKSACVNVYYQRAADLIRGFNIFTDPEGYEKNLARRMASCRDGPPEWVTMRDFARARADHENCPQPQDGRDRSLCNFYLLRTVFADIAGFNVEDANVLDTSVDLRLSYSYSFSLTFVDKTKRGLDIIAPPPESAACVCGWDSRGEPNAVLFTVCTVRRREGEECKDSEVGEMLRLATDVRMVDLKSERQDASSHVGQESAYGGTQNRRESVANSRTGPSQGSVSASEGDVVFPPFRKLSVVQSSDGHYHVYFMRNDAVLLRTLRKIRSEKSAKTKLPESVREDSGRTTTPEGNVGEAGEFACEPEVNVYDALTYLKTRVTSFSPNASDRIVTVDVRVHGRSDGYDGIKVVNSFGQKGLATFKDLRPYFARPPATDEDCNTDVSVAAEAVGAVLPVQLVMNNCSFVSRQPIGQFLQMKKNMHEVTTSARGEPTSVGFTPVFFTETEPVTKTCLVRFDEMMRSVVVTLGMAFFQNLKSSLDNMYNPHGVMYPPQMRQIVSLYNCVGVSYKFSGDDRYTPFARRDEVDFLIRLYDAYTKTQKASKSVVSKALLGVADALYDKHSARRLVDVGALSEVPPAEVDNTNNGRSGGSMRQTGGHRTYVLRLNDKWLKDLASLVDGVDLQITGKSPQQQPDYEFLIYDSKNDTKSTVYVFGEPSFIDTLLD